MGLQRLDKLATVGQLSAGLAHEIGSPLQILGGRARQLATRHDLPADVQRSARILEEQADRIANIVERLLGVARRKSAHMGHVDLGAAVAAVVELFEPEARRCGVTLEFEHAEALPRIVADPDQAQQVAMNLLTNALRATPRGGRVRVALVPSFFPSADGETRRASVALAVEDNGRGMSDEVRARIFEPFFTTGADAGWTGLGLAIVKAIVDEHGGTISVASEVGSGTRVTAHFPVAGSRSAGVMVA
jgi:signal transduction histidine kinase